VVVQQIEADVGPDALRLMRAIHAYTKRDRSAPTACIRTQPHNRKAAQLSVMSQHVVNVITRYLSWPHVATLSHSVFP